MQGAKLTKATWGGAVLAESHACVIVEGNSYFPAEAVAREYLRPSSTTTLCPWKGVAHYYDVEVQGKRNPTPLVLPRSEGRRERNQRPYRALERREYVGRNRSVAPRAAMSKKHSRNKSRQSARFLTRFPRARYGL